MADADRRNGESNREPDPHGAADDARDGGRPVVEPKWQTANNELPNVKLPDRDMWAEGNAARVEQDLSQVLREAWESLSGVGEAKDPEGQLPPLDDATLRALATLRSLPHVSSARRVAEGLRAGGSSDSTGTVPEIEGNAVEVRLVLSELLPQLSGDARRMREFVGGPLRATLERLERDVADRTEIATIVLALMRDMPKGLSERAIGAAPTLRGYLPARPSADAALYRAIGALADVLGKVPGNAADLRAFYYHEVLADAVLRCRAGEFPSNGDIWKPIKADANNVAVLCAKRFRGKVAPGRAVDVMSRSLKTSSAAAFASGDTELHELPRDLAEQSPWRQFSAAMSEKPRWVDLLDSMATVPVALGLSEMQRAYFQCMAGISRAITRNRERVAASFFNAAVAYDRTSDVQKPRVAPIVRALWYAIGLEFALAFFVGELEDALGEGDGLDCAVNLFGDLAEGVSELDAAVRAAATALASALDHALESAATFRRHPDRVRLRSFWKQAGLATEPTSMALGDAVSRFVDAAEARLFGVPSADLPVLARVARMIERSFVEIVYADDVAGMESVRTAVLASIEAFSSALGDPREVIVHQYGAIVDGGGPLVSAGVLQADDWRRIEASARIPVRSIVEVIDRLTT